MRYQPDPFFEAESAGPQVTFGFISPIDRYLAQKAGEQRDAGLGTSIVLPSIDIAPVDASAGAGISVTSGDLGVDLDTLYGKGWSVPGTATTPPSKARQAYLDQNPSAMTTAEAEYLGKHVAWDPVSKQYVRRQWSPTGLVVAGVGGAALLGAAFFMRRRSNPRRSRWAPLAALGGLGALLWYAAQRTVADVERAAAAASPLNESLNDGEAP